MSLLRLYQFSVLMMALFGVSLLGIAAGDAMIRAGDKRGRFVRYLGPLMAIYLTVYIMGQMIP